MDLKMNLSIFFVLAITIAMINAYTCPGEGVWPREGSINHFWSCLSAGEEGVEVKCADGLGFLRNKKNTGCIPFSDWDCTEKGADKPPICTESHGVLTPHLNPNSYWVCEEPNSAALKMTCPEGLLFVDNSEKHGCVPFNEWPCSDLVA